MGRGLPGVVALSFFRFTRECAHGSLLLRHGVLEHQTLRSTCAHLPTWPQGYMYPVAPVWPGHGGRRLKHRPRCGRSFGMGDGFLVRGVVCGQRIGGGDEPDHSPSGPLPGHRDSARSDHRLGGDDALRRTLHPRPPQDQPGEHLHRFRKPEARYGRGYYCDCPASCIMASTSPGSPANIWA